MPRSKKGTFTGGKAAKMAGKKGGRKSPGKGRRSKKK